MNKKTLPELVGDLEGVGFICEAGPLKNHESFIALQRMAFDQLDGQPVGTKTVPGPPTDYDEFLAAATDVFVAKDRDYESRFMRALVQYKAERGMEAARTIWAWEVEKKLDRVRTWIKRGELAVKGEGVLDSVIDLFNYTVQWRIFTACMATGTDPLALLNEQDFYHAAAMTDSTQLVGLLCDEKLIDPKSEVDHKTCNAIERYTGVDI